MRKYLLMHKNVEAAILLFREDGELSDIVAILKQSHFSNVLFFLSNRKAIIAWWNNRAARKSMEDIASVPGYLI